MTYAMAPTDPTNVVGRRVGAYLIDWVLLAALFLVPFASSAVSFDGGAFGSPFGRFAEEGLWSVSDLTDEDPLVVVTDSGIQRFAGDDVVYINGDGSGVIIERSAATMALGLPLVVGFAMFILLQGFTGATLGKLLLGIRVVREDGAPPGVLKAFIRSILWIVDGAFCGPLIGFISAMASKGHRRIGDMAAKTFVVRTADTGAPIVVAGLTSSAVPAGGWAAPQSAWDPAAAAPPAAGGVPGAPTAPAAAAPGLEDGSIPEAPAQSDPSQPQWDPQRNAYIAWDATAQRWQQYDDGAGEWRPI